jgi:putative oxidoreductase
MNQHMISRLAIFLLSFVMIFFGIQHFIHPQNMVTRVPDFLPGGIVWVYIVGTAFILAAVSFMSNILVRTAAYLLALMLLIFVFTIHLPQYLDTADNDYKQATLINMLKDTALAAFALYIASNARHQKVLEETTMEEEEREQKQKLVRREVA